ncbi:transmembrane protein, putative (macronuclear) [Tetrahymena thermophila SB210]|uniref:Transmembrane protein, putative n=1 Tax=Tetrahymena thermophila (strain SB210) TaxID=312017 RepID=W7WY91_TETTS|nr:transmembrane protein, putative [Tetrahymena thermophila SB210]EWS71815.1 transmembrane protein, putative [Tetrahymena thermophila SB210]|eukprot:XP_012655637.1 transmembrane protein, putative [Tetrahymena thermophila SB210]
MKYNQQSIDTNSVIETVKRDLQLVINKIFLWIQKAIFLINKRKIQIIYSKDLKQLQSLQINRNKTFIYRVKILRKKKNCLFDWNQHLYLDLYMCIYIIFLINNIYAYNIILLFCQYFPVNSINKLFQALFCFLFNLSGQKEIDQQQRQFISLNIYQFFFPSPKSLHYHQKIIIILKIKIQLTINIKYQLNKLFINVHFCVQSLEKLELCQLMGVVQKSLNYNFCFNFFQKDYYFLINYGFIFTNNHIIFTQNNLIHNGKYTITFRMQRLVLTQIRQANQSQLSI